MAPGRPPGGAGRLFDAQLQVALLDRRRQDDDLLALLHLENRRVERDDVGRRGQPQLAQQPQRVDRLRRLVKPSGSATEHTPAVSPAETIGS